MNLKNGKFVIFGFLVIVLAGCGNKTGSNRDLITQDEIEQNKKAAAMKRSDVIKKQ